MIIVVTGPTGVGKTKLSVMLAKKYNGIVINADACQVYSELNIGTAKVKEEEKNDIKHLMFDIKSPNEDYSVSDYQKDLRIILDNYKEKNIIIVGGTGLYITAGLYDYEFKKLEKKDYSNYSNEELYKMCNEIDKECNIHINNRVRLENFLDREGKVLREPKLLYDTIFIGLTTNRDNLYKRINQRVLDMFEDGLVDEVKGLVKKYGVTNIMKRAIGYKEVIKYLNNEITYDECVELIQKNSRRYAKRQYTWFNNKMDINWFDVDFNNFFNTYDKVCRFIQKNFD